MLNNLAKEAFTHALSCGLLDRAFTDALKTKMYLQMMQITSEIGEAHNALRSGDKINLSEEIADILIATLTLAWMVGMDADKMVRLKMAHNKGRDDHAGANL